MWSSASRVLAGSLAVLTVALPALAADIKVAINQSPWHDGFKRTAEQYQKETGNRVILDSIPYSGLLERIRHSVRNPQGLYDLNIVDSHWLAELYAGGFVTPVLDIAPQYSLPSEVLDFDETIYWDAKRNIFNKSTGKLMGFPVTGNVQFLYYRKDLLKEKGLKVPETWSELEAMASALTQAPGRYGFVIEGEREKCIFSAMPFMLSAGGGIFRNPREGDHTVIVDSEQSITGLKAYLKLAKSSYPRPASLVQGEIIQLLATGKAGSAVTVAAARGPLTDPNSSIIGDKVAVALIPRDPTGKHFVSSGHWIGTVPHNIPDSQKKAVVDFLSWLMRKESQVQLFENGSVPVRSDLVGAAKDPIGYLPVLAEAIRRAVLITPIKEGAEVYRILSLRINQAMLGEIGPEEAMSRGAAEVHEIMVKGGYKTGRLGSR
jgi:multiple sugar transport system substrate-binding protein